MTAALEVTYVYCVVAAAHPPASGSRLKPLPGGSPVRLIELPEVRRGTLAKKKLGSWLVVSDVPARLYGEQAIRAGLNDLDWISRLALAHEAVVETFSDQAAVLPMKLFTLFNSDARAQAFIAGDRRRIDRALLKVLDHQEWGVRVTRANVSADQARAAGNGRSTPTGASYLRKKKADRDRSTVLTRRAKTAMAALYRDLGRRSTLSSKRPPTDIPVKDGRLLMDAVFLVKRSKAQAFGAAVQRLAAPMQRVGCGVTLTGPWPPYSFVQD